MFIAHLKKMSFSGSRMNFINVKNAAPKHVKFRYYALRVLILNHSLKKQFKIGLNTLNQIIDLLHVCLELRD